jgi:hypothetical protein
MYWEIRARDEGVDVWAGKDHGDSSAYLDPEEAFEFANAVLDATAVVRSRIAQRERHSEGSEAVPEEASSSSAETTV